VEIAAKQDASTESRKGLMEAVKGFKRLSDEERAGAVNGLMKVFQDEVDALTRRARFSEKAFLSLFKDLVDAPDPAPLIGASADSAKAAARLAEENAKLTAALAAAQAAASRGSTDQAAEIDRLRSEVAQLEGELGKLQNQDITIRELEERITEFEGTIETQVAARLAERESELRRIFDGELEGVREAEMAAEGRVAALTAALADAVAQRDEAQAQAAALYEGGGGASGAAAGGGVGGGGRGTSSGGAAMVPAAEVEVLTSDNERLAARAGALEAELGEMRRRLAAAVAAASPGGGGDAAAAAAADGDGSSSSSLLLDPFSALRSQADAYRSRAAAAEEEVARLSSQLAQASEDGRQWAAMLDAQRSAHEGALAEAAARLAARDADVASLRAELSARPSHAELAGVKQQLALVQALTFPTAEDDVGADAGDGASGEAYDGASAAAAAAGAGGGASGGGGGAEGAEVDSSGGTGTGGRMDEVHSLMLRRIRQLEGRLVSAQTARADVESQLAAASAALTGAEDTLADQADLIRRLEEALAVQTGAATSSSAGSTAAGGSGGSSGSGAAGPATPSRPSAAGGASSSSQQLFSPEVQLESILLLKGGGSGSGRQQAGGNAAAPGGSLSAVGTPVADRRGRVSFVPSPDGGDGARPASPLVDGSSVGATAAGPAAPTTAADPSSMLEILRGQRDRFRQRMLEVEAEAQGRIAELADARGAVARLTSDNVRLYEKIRYLQSFLNNSNNTSSGGGDADAEAGHAGSGSGGSSGGSSLRSRAVAAAAAAASGFALGGEDDFEGPYRRMYADTIDPFTDFSRRERARQYARLSPAEKITLTSSRFFLSSRFARNFVFFYVVALHLLVMATLWHFAHVSHRGGCAEDIHDLDGGGGSSAGGVFAGGDQHAPGFSRFLPKSLRGAGAGGGADAAAAAATGGAT
jgi:hypothetical protein